MKDPAFLFYSADFIVGTMAMSFEDRGKYITILCLQHQHGRLEEKTISLLVGSISVMLKSKFNIDENGLWYNERLEAEISKRKSFIESRSTNGKKGGRPKKEEKLNKTTSFHLAKAKQKLGINININENINEIKNIIEYCKQFFEEKYLNGKTSKTFETLLKEYSIDQIKDAIKKAKTDQFWTNQFLSPCKLTNTNKDGVKYIDVFIKLNQKLINPNWVTQKGIQAAMEDPDANHF
jgi:uncharacterized protein YdaU (DUF1376 family)